MMPPNGDWAGPGGELGDYIAEESQKTLNAYREQPNSVDEHANHEADTARGGYARRQLFELVQNSADALIGVQGGGRITIRLTETYLYCADDGKRIDRDGVKALMFSHLSPKRGTSEIGRFGLGFKSVLGVTDAPEFFSRSGSFRFDRDRSRDRIREVAPNAERYPALRLPDPIHPRENRDEDNILRELMGWATNIVRLPLKHNARDNLEQQMRDFPPEFLLFVEHVGKLTLRDETPETSRTFELQKVEEPNVYLLGEDKQDSGWKLFKRTHSLSSDARDDKRALDDGDEVPIWWAAPLDRLNVPGYFWAFFPTQSASLVAGILNAPWKTNEDRQNLLPGKYNEELIDAAVEMVADALPDLATDEDPARHLDALPRRGEPGDTEHINRIREGLYSTLGSRAIVPDQDGELRRVGEISYPPGELTEHRLVMEPLKRWAEYPGRPRNWLHHEALPRNRISRIDRLFSSAFPYHPGKAPRKALSDWLAVLVAEGEESNDAVRASMAAIQTAALIPPDIRRTQNSLGSIVRTASDAWREPDPERLFLPEESGNGWRVPDSGESCVHPKLAADGETLSALKELGIKPPSPESIFRLAAKEVLDSTSPPSDDLLRKFWLQARKVGDAARDIIVESLKDRRSELESRLRIRTRSGDWRLSCEVLLPGSIVPGDGSRDDCVTVDMDFHAPDSGLLRALGVVDAPQPDRCLASEPRFPDFLDRCRRRFQDSIEKNPRLDLLNFASSKGSGPLEVFRTLSDEAKVRYTHALLFLDATFEEWEMKHDNPGYPKRSYKSPAVSMLREHGRVRTCESIVPFKDGLGAQPKNQAALHALLAHSEADRIKKVFDLSEPSPEFIGEEDAIPLTDVWPGLKERLPAERQACELIRCERILVAGKTKEALFHAPNVYLTHTADDDESHELRLVCESLELRLSAAQLEGIRQYRTRQEIEKRRATVRECSTDAERLLAAVGESALRRDLPDSLLAIRESDDGVVADIQLAKDAIAIYHSDALRRFRGALGALDPPQQWAGRRPAVEFVRSLGFSAEWAGKGGNRRDPFLEIEGPYSLPGLHDYQKKIVANVRRMFRNGGVDGTGRRGMISLPTGSGKTRVAVQAIVDAMREDGFEGGILWVADRDELCEQAVEAWRQAWSSIGAAGAQLRISRMWGSQSRPEPTSDLHVVVATIQTLDARFKRQTGEYEFLSDFKLVVFDEAHRSIARTFTSVMREIGLTQRNKADDPFLLGLTATPYRGYDEAETRRLRNRYGRKRFDFGAFERDDPEHVIGELQEMCVLARAEHETIEGGEFRLNDSERQEAESAPWLPESVEKRIAADADRTKRIIEAYEKHVDGDWPTLVFATSVAHAKTVAALLNERGITSRAVSAETEISTRRRIVEEFRRGEVKALVNYGVFREGFDAPRTRAIIVARPVYSPNLYFQMIGRGLRGVLNGGNDRCLILNVRDNIQNFEGALAFSDLDWLWA